MIGSVTRRAEFDALRINGQRVRRGSLRVTHTESIRPTDEVASYQLCFAINRKFGSAVERNRARRRLRAAFEVMAHQGDAGKMVTGMYLIIPTRRVLKQPFAEVLSDLGACADLLNPQSSPATAALR